MIEVKEGIDLDRAIAGVIGLICTQRVLGSDIEFYVDPRAGTNAVPRTFKPSTNLNDAFQAAEVTGVFSNYRVLRKNRHHWEVYEIGEDLDRVVSSGETSALAVCAAILKLEESKRP